MRSCGDAQVALVPQALDFSNGRAGDKPLQVSLYVYRQCSSLWRGPSLDVKQRYGGQGEPVTDCVFMATELRIKYCKRGFDRLQP